jgi:ketosteroid isomerase-like protein
MRASRLLPLSLALWAIAAEVSAQSVEDEGSRELRALENQLSKALVERDAATLDRLWHDHLILISPNGSQSGKAQRLALQGTATPRAEGETNVNDEVSVHIEGATAVVLVQSTWTTPSPTSVSVGKYRALHVWTREAGVWRLLAVQIVRVA